MYILSDEHFKRSRYLARHSYRMRSGKLLRGTSATFNFFNFISSLFLLVSVLASAKPVWLNFGQHWEDQLRRTTTVAKKRQNWWARDQNKRSKQKLTCYVTKTFKGSTPREYARPPRTSFLWPCQMNTTGIPHGENYKSVWLMSGQCLLGIKLHWHRPKAKNPL